MSPQASKTDTAAAAPVTRPQAAPETPPPYGSYAVLVTTFVGGIAAMSAVAAHRGLRPTAKRPLDLVILGLATFKTARSLATDDVLSFVREPFVEGMPDDAHDERPVSGPGPRRALGQLLTCSRCVGTWAAAGLTTTEIFAPRFGRALTLSLAVGGANDWLQAGFAALTGAANRHEAAPDG